MNSPETRDAQDSEAPEPQQAAEPADGQLAAAKKEAAENQDRYLRAMADLENFLPALDNLALGLASARQPKADLKSLAGGVELVQQQLKGALAAHGLKEINPLGQPFDPHQHEAISHEPSPDVAAERVLRVVRTGYVLNGRLLRPASVVISSGKPVEGAAG